MHPSDGPILTAPNPSPSKSRFYSVRSAVGIRCNSPKLICTISKDELKGGVKSENEAIPPVCSESIIRKQSVLGVKDSNPE